MMSYKGLRYRFCLIILVLLIHHSSAQKHLSRWQTLDVQHYSLSIDLNDTSDMIYANADISISFRKPAETFFLDFKEKDANQKGMVVKSIMENGRTVDFWHRNDSLIIDATGTEANISKTYQIEYSGIPSNGLIISKNKFGDRTFFADNWPDRAHNWLPCVDHPSDKATVEFKITAPDYYQVIANGNLVVESQYDNHYKLTHWRTDELLPTKVLAIGVARFAIENVENELNIPVSTWVFPQNAEEGFRDYRIAVKPLKYFISGIGPYPFSKLANVQATTLYGGMENAGNIFYHERLVTGKEEQEEIITHEIAHQWFGNSVTEGNWHHVWLSEGFATYLTDLYYESMYGHEIFLSRMKNERNEVIEYAARHLSPVIDTSVTNYRRLLNPNSYQKGAWFLHMLRKELGDTLFQKCIIMFYRKYQYQNALSEDLQNIAESVSGKDLDYFFEQWLYEPGFPVMEISWQQKDSKVVIEIKQVQGVFLFHFPLELELINSAGTTRKETVYIDQAIKTFTVVVEGIIDSIIPDPDVWLLFKADVKKGF